MRFLFRIDLILYVGAGKKFGILNFATKQGVSCKNFWNFGTVALSFVFGNYYLIMG